MGGFEDQVRKRTYGLKIKIFVKKGVKVVGNSCKRGWYKIKHIRR